MLPILETLKEYDDAANHLLAISDRPVLITAARVLAAYVGHYQLQYGPIGAPAIADMNTTLPSSAQLADRIEGLRVLASALTLAALSNPDQREE
jgi:hypothetical protein